jgi:hypothetical protein
MKLKDPKCNDREWSVYPSEFVFPHVSHLIRFRFKLHGASFFCVEGNEADFSLEPVYRLAEKEWKDFIESFTDVLAEVDTQIPHLPPKDVIHRIYRDVSVLSTQLHVYTLRCRFASAMTKRRIREDSQRASLAAAGRASSLAVSRSLCRQERLDIDDKLKTQIMCEIRFLRCLLLPTCI